MGDAGTAEHGSDKSGHGLGASLFEARAQGCDRYEVVKIRDRLPRARKRPCREVIYHGNPSVSSNLSISCMNVNHHRYHVGATAPGWVLTSSRTYTTRVVIPAEDPKALNRARVSPSAALRYGNCLPKMRPAAEKLHRSSVSPTTALHVLNWRPRTCPKTPAYSFMHPHSIDEQKCSSRCPASITLSTRTQSIGPRITYGSDGSAVVETLSRLRRRAMYCYSNHSQVQPHLHA